MVLTKIISAVKSKLKVHSLKTKLIFAIFLLFAFYIVVIISNNLIMSLLLKEKINHSIINNINQTNVYLSFMFTKAKELSIDLSVSFFENENTKKLFNSLPKENIDSYDQYKAINDIYTNIIYRVRNNSEIDSIYIYSETAKQLITSQAGIFSYNSIKDYAWIQSALSYDDNDKKAFNWLGYCYDRDLYNLHSKKHLLSLISRADIINRNLKSPVYIGINYDEKYIYEIINNIKLTPNTLVYLIDENKRIISAEDKSIIGTIIDNANDLDLSNSNELITSRVKIENAGSYQRLYQKNPVTGWAILMFIPEKELLLEQKIIWITVITTLVLVSFILVHIASRIVSRYVEKPVTKLIRYMSMAEKGDFSNQITEQTQDEFDSLYRSYNEMISRIKTLIKELYKEKLLKREAELKHLQKQINPHFLYNTLDTINWIAKSHNAHDISQIVIALSNLYRSIFNKGKDYVEITHTLQSIENYLYIQKFRYGNSFSYNISMDERLKGYIILNLLIQPVVENALVHGIARKNGVGTICITASLDDNIIRFTIKDDGAGMSEEQLKLLLANINSQHITSDSGLKNVNNRIKLFYGEKYGLSIKSELGKGTCVEICLPAFEYLQC
ncbi:MAG TPA: histidine kinase [Clostridiaceae bacterium]|nr:histidine kinase [Clostridiaceae bacterium]